MDLLNQLKTNPDNPRIINKEEFEKLKSSIKEFTQFLKERPILYDEDKIIWAGNQRFRGLKVLIEEDLIKDNPDFYRELKGYSKKEKMRIAILDNSPIGLSGKWDYDILSNKWSDLPLEEWGINMTGWTDFDYNDSWKDMPEFGDKASFNALKSLMVHFETQEAIDMFAKLMKQKITEKTKYIWYPKKEKEDNKSLEFKTLDD